MLATWEYCQSSQVRAATRTTFTWQDRAVNRWLRLEEENIALHLALLCCLMFSLDLPSCAKCCQPKAVALHIGINFKPVFLSCFRS